ncbi:MAG: chain length-determining protein [Gammaproteobacteria bacterium]|nr:chain length-determining protein [Gammaproteobacteria bacterium]
MHELITQILGYTRGVWRYRWWILGLAWLVSVVGWTVVAKMPDQYSASARVFVDTQTILGPLLKGLAVRGNEEQQLLMMTQTLMSRPNLEKVMRMTDLDLRAKTDGEKDKIIDGLKRDISLKSTRRVNLYTIDYPNSDPELAKLVVKSLLTIFVESNLGESRKEQDSAQRFLEQQIADYEMRLVEAEERRKQFKQKNLAFLPGEGGGYYARLRETQAQLKQAELELKIQQDRLKVLDEQIANESETIARAEGSDPVAPTALESRISGLESRLDDLLLKYTERHPDVLALKATLKTLKKQQEAEGSSESARNAARIGNPVYQQIKVLHSEVEADIAARQVLVTEYGERIKQLEAAVDKVLHVETEEAQLNRDYNLLKEKHQDLLARLESAKLGQDVETKAESVRFKIIDPPVVPSKPSGPNRTLLSTLVVLAGLGVGVALAFLFSQIRPTFDSRQILNDVTNLPVLGSVSMIWTKEQVRMRQRRHIAFLFGLLALVTMYAGVMMIHMLEIGAPDLLRRALAVVGI